MSWQRITNKTLYSLGLSKYCSKLKHLYLEDCQISDIGVDELSESENSLSLETLVLNNSIKQKNNLITDKSLSSIAFSKYLINLKTLEMRNLDITPKGLKTLSVSMAAEKIETLRLSHCSKLDE
jgi:23S rRNA pseudoU1915 N3-methylase RlmH